MLFCSCLPLFSWRCSNLLYENSLILNIEMMKLLLVKKSNVFSSLCFVGPFLKNILSVFSVLEGILKNPKILVSLMCLAHQRSQNTLEADCSAWSSRNLMKR